MYLEVGEHEDVAKGVIERFLAARSQEIPGLSFTTDSIRPHAHGYEVDIPLQLIPEVVRELSRENVAVYQVIRINKV